jgi:Tfp pilus assembly protein PilE
MLLKEKHHHFSMVELAVVAAILMILISLISPSIAKISSQANKIECQSNMKTLSNGWQMFSEDYNGKLARGQNVYNANPELNGWVGQTSQPGSARLHSVAIQTQNIQRGSLYPYTQSLNAYHCSLSKENDLRSFSTVHSMNGSRWFTQNQGGEFFSKMHEITSPSKRVAFLDDYNEDWDASFAIPRTFERWWNPISVRHGDGLSWMAADGHTEFYQFVDNRTLIGFDKSWRERLSIMNSIDLTHNKDLRNLGRLVWGVNKLPYE